MVSRLLVLCIVAAAGLAQAACQVEQRRGPTRMRYQDPAIKFNDPGQFGKK
jgi:hypothetical protein